MKEPGFVQLVYPLKQQFRSKVSHFTSRVLSHNHNGDRDASGFIRDTLSLFKRKWRSSVLREPASIDGQWNRLQLFKLVSQGGYTEKPNTRGIDKDSKKKSANNSLESPIQNLVINVFV